MSNFDELVKRARARVEKRRAELGYGEVPKGFTLVNDEEFKEPLRFISSPESEKLDTDIDIPEPVTVGGLLNDGTSGAMQASIGLGRGVVNTADFIGTQVVHNPRELFTKGLDGDFKFIEPNTARALNLMTGYDPKEANSIIEANKSSAYHQQQRELQQDYNNAQTLTDKFLVGTKTITKPNVASSTVGQLAVDVASGGGLGKVFGAGRTATALGETAVVFNHMLNQTLDETGSVTPTQASKLATGALVSYGLSRYLNGGANLENVLAGNAVKGANAVVNVGKEGLQETLQGATESSATQSAINLDGSVDMGQVAFDAGAEGAFGTALGTATQTMQGLSKTKEITQAGVNKAGETIKKNYGDTYENLLNPEHKKYNPTDAYLKAQQENNEEMQKQAYEHARNHEDPSYLRDILTHARITTYQDGEQLDDPEYFSNLANSYQQATTNTIKSTGKTITIGDSLAVGYYNTHKPQATTAVVGSSPKAVLAQIQQLKKADVQGSSIVLSSGLSNDTQQINYVEEQIQTLKAKGVSDIKLMGVAKNYKGNNQLGKELNDQLATLANKYGITFLGGFTAGSDKVHPNNNYYKSLVSKQTSNNTSTVSKSLSVVDIKNSTIKQLPSGRWTSDNPLIARIIAIESMGNANAHRSGSKYKGLFQLNSNNKQDYNAKNYFDPHENFKLAKAVLVKNAIALQKAGIPITATSIYLTHQQGLGGFKAIYSASLQGKDIPYMPAKRKAGGDVRYNMDNNGGKGLSPKDFLAYWDKRIERDYTNMAKTYGFKPIGLDTAQNASQSSTVAPIGLGGVIVPDDGNTEPQVPTEQTEPQVNQEPVETVETEETKAIKQEAQSNITKRYSLTDIADTADVDKTKNSINELESTGAISTTLANNLRALLDIKVQIKGNTTAEVYDQIMNGKQGATHLESNLGLKQYEEVFSAGKGFLANLYREYLDRFVNDHVSKANAIKQALKDFKGTSIILGFDEETNQWQRVETDGELAPNTRQFIVSTNSANATMKSIIQEAELLSKFRDHWFSILDGSVEPVESSKKQSDTITLPKPNKPVDKPVQASKGVSGKAVFVGRAHSKSMSDVANNNVAYQGMFGNPFTISKDKTGGYFVSNEQEQMDRYIHNVFANYSAHEYFRDEVLRSKSNGIRTGKNAHKEAKVIDQLNNFLETNPEYVSNPNKLTKIANRAYWDKDKGLVINVKQDKTDTDGDIHSNVITSTTDTAHSNDTDNTTPTNVVYEDANNDDYIQAQREWDLLYQGQFDDTNGYYEQDTSQQVNRQQDDDSLRSKVSGTSKHTRQAPKGINVKPVEIVNNKLDIKAGKHYLLDIVNTLGLNQDELFIVQAIAKKYPKLTISFDGTQADISSPKNITQAVVKYSTSQILSIINEDTTDTDLLGLRDELDLIQERIKQVNGLNELSKKEKALIEESISDYAKLILLGTSNDTLIGLLKRIETNGKARQSLFTKLINGMKSFLGIANKDSVHNLYERLLSVTGTLIDIQAKDNKVSYKNELFKQNDKTNIAGINNLATRLKLYGVNGLQDKPNEIQEKELSYFLGFNDDFKQHLIASYDEHGNKYKDLKALLNQGTKDNPKFDENIYTALALIAYEYLKINGGSIYNKPKDVNKLLGVDIELDLPHEIYKKYLLAGKSINEVTTGLGRDVVKLLDYEANANTPATTIARLEASMGSWLLSAMQVADMVNIHEFNQAEYENDKRIVQGLEANVAKTDKTIKTVSFTALDNTATNDVIDEVISHSKGTQNYLSNLFGLESRKVYPLLKPSNYVNDTIQRTKAKVSKKQQALVQSMQQEAIVLNQDMYGVMSALQEMDSTFLADIFGARVTDEQLAKKHISKRLSMQATAESIQRDLEHYFEWANSLPTTDTKFYDRIKVVINDRMHYASNVFNFQSSKVHRALGEYDSFKTEIDLTDFDGSTWFDKDNKPLAITLFLRAVFENAEGTEDIFKEQFIKYGLADGHTVDKVPSDIFMPVAWNYLTTDKQVANAVLAMQSLLAGNTLNQQQKQDILDLVKAWDMQGQSFRALLEITNLFTAIENNTTFTTSLGLGSDGINNGTAIGFILNAIDNVVTLARVGIFKKDTPFTNYFQTRNIKEIGDYYTAYMPVLAEAINGLDNNTQAFEYLNNTLFTRKMAKAILIPFGYGAGTKRLIQASSKQMMKDIISRIEDIVKTNNIDEYNKLQQAISAVTNYKLAPIDKLLETPIPEYVEFNLRDSYEQVMGKAIAQSIKEYAGELITRRDNHIAIHNAITEQYLSLRALVEAKAEQERIKRLEAKYKGKELNEAIKYQTLTKEEIAKYIDEPLAKIYPKLHSAYSQDESASVGFDLLDRASTLIQDDGIDNRAYQYTGDNKLSAKSIKTLVRAKVLQSAGVRPYSQQIQHMDSYVSAHASTANGVVSINVHDANIGSMSNYIAMTLAQNKAFFDGTLNYHAYYQNLSALVSAMNGFKELDIELNQEQMNELVVSWFKPMLKGDSLKQFKKATLQGRVFNQAMVDTILGLAYAGLQADIAKLDMYANTQSIQQYAGEAGEYILTDKDYEQIQAIKTKLVADSNKLYDELQQALQAYTPSKVVAIEGVHYGKGGDTWDVSKVTPNNIHKPYIWDKLLPAFIDGKKLSVQGEDQSKAKQIAEYLLDYLAKTNNNSLASQIDTIKQSYGTNKLLEHIAKLNPDVSISLVSDVASISDSYIRNQLHEGGVYIPESNTVYININKGEWYSSELELINHELVHSVTAKAIDSGKYDSEIDKLLESIQAYLYKGDMSDDVRDRIAYMVMNQNSRHELFSIGFAERQVRDVLTKAIDINQLNKLFTRITNEFSQDSNTQYAQGNFEQLAGVTNNRTVGTITQHTTADSTSQEQYRVGTDKSASTKGTTKETQHDRAVPVQKPTNDLSGDGRQLRQDSGQVSNIPAKARVNIWFGSNENAHLSNLALRPFTAKNGKTYQSVEHFYQSHKTGKFNQTLYDNPAWFKAGTKLAQGKPKTQDNYNISLMRAGIKFSFEQNLQALAELLATGNQEFTHKQDKGIWAKEFPRLLMEVRDELRAKTNKQVAEFIDNTLTSHDPRAELELFGVTQKEIDIVKQHGLDIAGLIHTLDAVSVKHAIKKHGNDSKFEATQRDLTAKDLKRIADVLSGFDELKVQNKGTNRSSLVYSKQFGDGRIEYVERVIETSRDKKPRLLTKTVWVKSATGVIATSLPQVSTPDRQDNHNILSKQTQAVYEQLSAKTRDGQVMLPNDIGVGNIKAVAPKFKKQYPQGLIAYRYDGMKDLLGNFLKHGYVGNPFNWQKVGEEQAVKLFIDWLITGNNHNNHHASAEYRKAIIDSIALHKEQPILYYKELNAPSHANALDYLINSYDWQGTNQDMNALLGTLPPYSTSTDVQVAQPTTGHKLSVRDLLDGVKHDGDNNSFGFKPVQESRVLDKKTKITYKDISFHTKSFDINQVTKAVSKYGLDGTAQAKLFSILATQTKLNPKVKFVIDDADKQKGYYNTLTNTIHLNQALTDTKHKLATINHELIHALTETGLRQGGKAVDDLTKMYHQLKDKAQGQFAKELENIHEFASYGLTDDNFANFIANNLDLKAIGIKPKNRLASAFEAFVQAMYSVLGLKRSVAYKTFVNAVMDSMVVYQAIGTETKRNNQDIFTVPTVVQSTFNKDIDNLETSLRSNPRPVTTNMPPVLLALDGKQGLAIKDLPLELDKFTLRKMQGKVSGKADDSHALTLADIKSLLPELYNPVAVLVSDNLQGLTVITSMTKNGHEILVPIHLNKSKGKYVFNDIASAFGKENFNAWFSKRIDKVIYYNKNLTSSTLPHRLGKLDTSHVGVVDDVSTFPKVVPTASKVNQSIATPDDIIKRYSRIQLDDVVDDLETQAKVLQGKPVVSVYEDDLNMPKSGGFKAITVWAKELFNAWDNKAINHKLGEVSLNDQSIRDSLAHGFNPYKNIAFASVKSVIEKGSIVAIDTRNGEDSIYISAPVLVNGLENIVTVLVHRDINTQRMYLHSIMLKENLLVPRDSKAPTKVGKQNGSMTPVGVSTTQSRVSETQETSSRKHIGSLTEETDKIPAGLRISEAPVSTGKQNSSIAPAGNPSSKHKGMLTSMDIRNILHTALTYKGKRYSQATTAETIADTINQMSTTEVFKQLSRGSISDEHNTHLDDLVDMLIEGYITRYNSVKSSDPIKGKLKNKARLNGFKSSEKESYITRALIEVISQYRQNHKGSIAVNQMDRAFNQALKDYPNATKLFSHYHGTSKEEQQRLNKMYQYVFKNQDKEDNVARFMAMVLANEEFRLAMTQVKPSKEIDGWFDWVMNKVQSILDWFTTKLFKSDKALDGYVKALVYLEKQARLEHTDSLQKIYAYVQQTMTKLSDKPVLGAIKLATKLPYIKQHSMTKALATVLDNPQIANRWVSDTFADTRQQTFIDFMAELGQFGNRGQFIDKATRLTSKIAQDRQVIKSSMIKVLNGLFDKELSKEAKTAITYGLLRTDMSALIRHGFKEILSLLDKTKRDKEIAKQLALLKPLVSDEAYQDMIYQMQALAKYMVVGEATPALVKSAQGIAQGLGGDYQTKTLNQEVFKIVDVLTTLYALDFVENKHIKQLQSLDSKALMKVLDIHKEQVIKSQDEFKHNPLNYTKGYLPDITNPQHKLVFATSDDEIAQYKAQGFVELYKLNQDPADDTEQRTLMLHDSYASRDYVSGAIDLYDKHAKGTIIYTDQDVANIEAKIKKDREFRQARLLGLNPEVPSSVLVPTYHTDGSIMNYHYEMNGYTKDTYLERNNDFDLLLANLASDLAYKPMVEQLQKEIAKWLYQDSITNYAKHPRDYRLIHVYDDVMARILPYTMRNEIYRLWGKGTAIPIHKSVYTALLGYEAYSLVNIFDKLANHEKLNFAEKALVWLLTKLFGNQARKNLLHIEKSVQQLMQLIKDVIVIRSGTVLLGNIFANTLLLALHGINPIRILQDTLFAWRNVKRYSKDINELEQVKIKLLADNSQLLQTKKKTLEQAIKNNPLHEYMQQGMMSTIVEDLDTQKVYQYETMLDKQINKLRDKVNPKLLKTFDVVAMNSGSVVHDFLTEATQFSDFSAKYVLANYLQEQGKKLDNTIHEANLSFINYDIPTNKALDYFNRIGLMMFTKFFLRFQNVLWRLGLKLPARVLSQHFAIENLGQQGVLDPFFVNRLGNPFDDSIFNGLFLADDLLTSKVVSSIL